MSDRYKQVADFAIEGQVLAVEWKKYNQPKQLQLATDHGNYFIKISKPLRAVGLSVQPGDWVRVVGEKTLDRKKLKCKWKAQQLLPLSEKNLTADPSVTPKLPLTQPQGKILVCQKSDCCKRGGKKIYQALEKALGDRGLSDRVQIQKTGCLKCCKAGPNVVFLPSKTHHSRISPEEIPALVEQHFA